ncbi:MAG: ABC transporter ATP-binding protein [Alphaproteobacteria bacterium]|nr:ABC transporter ATP-binding protein [Alphaproteobacteria bacterium]
MENRSDFVSLRDVSKYFGSVRAVDGVSLDIAQGEFFALLGPSGCGKTTLLRILGGFEASNSGSVHIDGANLTDEPANLRPVNMVFQNYAIFPHLNVRQNIGYGLRQEGLSAAEMSQRIDEALATVKLEGYGDRGSTELSGGQRQRVALARALVKHPKVLLLDEPLSALDKNLRELMRVELRALQQKVGITFIFVTHDQEEALSMADRIAVMSDGKVRQVDTPEHLYEAPATREVAAFIGSMNFLDGSVEGAANGMVTVNAGPLGKLQVKPSGDGAPAAGEAVTIGIRPEKLTLLDKAPASGDNVIKGRLTAASYLGERNHFFVSVEGVDAPISVASQNSSPVDHKGWIEGSEVWLTWKPEGARLLLS